ncbi:MAG TPA: glycogen debranching protein [Syntrophothermus lipocalidus]|nr:glycogen debranching protein [Syntrophothermus lipocalidus]
MLVFAGPQLGPPAGTKREWLLTNGIGGFASSTVSGINTRKYHGLLVAALNPPVERRLLLAKLEEEVCVESRKYSLFCSQTVGGYSGHGFEFLHEFRRFPFPTYIYRLENIFIRKEIMMVRGENTVLILYHVLNPDNLNFRLCLFPLVTNRDYHWTVRKNKWPFLTSIQDNRVMIEAYPGAPKLYLSADRGRLQRAGFWYYDLFYELEAERGLDAVEDLYCPVKFEIESNRSLSWALRASTEDLAIDQEWVLKQRNESLDRMKRLGRALPQTDNHIKVLTLAADDFIVERRNTGKKTIIAGYPWFTDWGRDAMIALPGLTLVTGRYRDAREIIKGFVDWVQEGLVPNCFSDDSGCPHYNTVDASLWLFWAVYKYLEYTGDWDFVNEVYPCLCTIVDDYCRGTRYGIKVDKDGLVTQGEEGMALTWMDARIAGQPVTPRRGKAVEINSLWHFAARFLAYLTCRFGRPRSGKEFTKLADLVRSSFVREFWFEPGGYLYDVVGEVDKDATLRCNQVIAVSLPTRLLNSEQEKSVIRKVWRELYTPFGLRTLCPLSEGYKGTYGGSEHERDRAYHQGTVWVWPWGHFVTAVSRIYADYSGRLTLIKKMVKPLLIHLEDGCVGNVSEIFDGDFPHSPRGCFAQAWSVGEVLRVYAEEVMGVKGRHKIDIQD